LAIGRHDRYPCHDRAERDIANEDYDNQSPQAVAILLNSAVVDWNFAKTVPQKTSDQVRRVGKKKARYQAKGGVLIVRLLKKKVSIIS